MSKILLLEKPLTLRIAICFQVTYSTSGFLEMNNDKLATSILEYLRGSIQYCVECSVECRILPSRAARKFERQTLD